MSVSAPDTTPPDGAQRPAVVVAQAVGILSVQRRCSPEEALRLLTELAARTGRTVPEQADRLIRRYPRLHSVLTRMDGPGRRDGQ